MDSMGLIKQAFRMKQEMAKIQKELSRIEIEVSSNDGSVRVTMGGDQKLRSIKLDADAVNDNGVAALETLIVKTVNTASLKVQDRARELFKAKGLLDIPGLNV